MIKQWIYLFFGLTLALGGCSIHDPKSDFSPSQEKIAEKRVELAPGVYLNLRKLWPLRGSGSYLQRVKTVVGKQEHSVSVHITLTPDRLDFIAFNDIIGRLYTLTWTEDKTEWQASDYIPSSMCPENIIGDFLLVHLDLNQLNQSLEGAQVIDRNDERVIQTCDGVIRKITRQNRQKDFWKKATIENSKLGYYLEIETVTVQ